MDNKVIYQFERNNQESVCLTLREYKGRKYLDLRIYFLPVDGTELVPTKKGLTLEVGLLGELEKGIQAVKLGLALAILEG